MAAGPAKKSESGKSDDWLARREAWRARREARRAKQRVANVDRAKQMHVARLAAERKDDVPPGNRAHAQAALNIGCSGWYYWHWRGQFYPESIPSSRWFAHYASNFSTVELNAPFYSWPTVGGVKSWIRQAGRKRFLYTVKVCELITHVKRFVGTKTLVSDFNYIADLLGPHMGCFLFQLPPSLRYSLPLLKRIIAQLDPARKNVVEFRHKSWWNETVYGAFRQAGIIFCCCSGPRLPGELVKTADDIYVRFHGTKRWYRHDYTRDELQEWAGRIRASGAKRVWAYFNNDRDGYAIKNARMLMRLLKQP